MDEDSKISFWQNVWFGDQSLKVGFPKLFSIACFIYPKSVACFNDASVADYL